jgi:hypothetical protein
MGRTSTRLKIIFFGLLLAGTIVIQYCWVSTLLKDKQEKFKHLVVSGINDAANNIGFTESSYQISNALRQSFANKGLGAIPFECWIGAEDDKHPSTHLTLHYLFQEKTLTVVILFWKSIVWRQMTWPVVASVLLTIMILVIFCCALISGGTGFYRKRTNAINNLMQQLETPLSTVSVAAEALRHARVVRDLRKISYYQQVIDKENKHINEQVERFLQALK